MSEPLVSIIVRTKDRPKLLKRALQSIGAQTYRPIEVVLVNDGGCDLDIEGLRIILADISLNYRELEKNMGRAYAGNVGIENSVGDYLGFLDDDDEFFPEHILLLVTALQDKGKDFSIAYTDSLMVYKEFDAQKQDLIKVEEKLINSEDFNYDKLIFDNYIPFMCLLFRREVLEQTGGLDVDFELFEDYDLLLRLGEKHPFYHIDKITAFYNQWSSHSQISQANSDSNFLRSAYLKLFEKHIEKFTPERIYGYRSVITNEKDMRIKVLEALERNKDTYIKNLEAMEHYKDTYIKNLNDVIKGKDQYITGVAHQIKNLNDVIKGKDQYITSIAHQLSEQKAHSESVESIIIQKDAELQAIYGSKGWKVLMFYYRLREIIFPMGSWRRKLAKYFFNWLVMCIQGFKKKIAEPGNFLWGLETEVPPLFVVGAGNILCLSGWCCHTTEKIKRVSLLIDGVEHIVTRHGLARCDLFHAHFRKCDSAVQDLHGGFSAFISFAPVASPCKVYVVLRAELSEGEIIEADLGTITLVPSLQEITISSAPFHERTVQPLVCICMAAYNPSLDFFQKQIESIRNQDYSHWLCIISDDCSRPEVFEGMQKIISGDKRFRLYSNTVNCGFYNNFERCLIHVPDDVSFIALSDQDDIWHENKLSVLLSHFDEQTFLAYSDMRIVDADETVINPTYWSTRKNNYSALDLLLIANTVTGAASMFRRELLPYILPFPQRIGEAYHDNFIACVALALGDVSYVDRPLYDYRQHSANIFGHKSHAKKGLKDIFLFVRALFSVRRLKDFFRQFGPLIEAYNGVYITDFLRTVIIARIIAMRCPGINSKKDRILKRFSRLDSQPGWIVFEVIKNAVLRRNDVTVGNDSRLLKALLASKAGSLYNKFK